MGREVLREVAVNAPYAVEIILYGEALAEKAYMGKTSFPAAKCALQAADLTLADTAAVKTHSPFVVNDLYTAHANGLRSLAGELKHNFFAQVLISSS